MMALLAEFLGTFALMSAVLFSGNWLFIGLTLAFVGWTVGSISGAHVNPAITLTQWIRGSHSTSNLLSYIIIQILGAVAALYVYKSLA